MFLFPLCHRSEEKKIAQGGEKRKREKSKTTVGGWNVTEYFKGESILCLEETFIFHVKYIKYDRRREMRE